jgi:ABC-type antimicrobial peptide transport system ATPase subunit
MTEPLLRVVNLEKKFPIQRGLLKRTVGQIHAVDGISFEIAQGETLGLVGESGCGKSTTARLILRLLDPTNGEIYFDGKEIHTLSREEIRKERKNMQIVFQDPYASLNPRMTVRQIVAEPLIVHGLAKDDSDPAVDEMIELCGLSREFGNRYPHEFSGGQRQRVGIARALVTRPKLHWTYLFKLKSLTCLMIYVKNLVLATSLWPTTYQLFHISQHAWQLCILERLLKLEPAKISSKTLSTLIQRRLSLQFHLLIQSRSESARLLELC